MENAQKYVIIVVLTYYPHKLLDFIQFTLSP
jgi:hypothetical protein